MAVPRKYRLRPLYQQTTEVLPDSPGSNAPRLLRTHQAAMAFRKYKLIHVHRKAGKVHLTYARSDFPAIAHFVFERKFWHSKR